MDLISFFSGAGVLGVLLTVLGFLAKGWVEARISQSIKHEYDVLLDDHKRAHEVRARAALVAEFMSEWIADSPDYKRLNELSFQAFLWLPDELARDLSNTLSHKDGAKSVRDIVVAARKHLLGGSDALEAKYVITFPKKHA